MLIRRLHESDNRQRFESGDASLDVFLVKYAGQNQFRLHVGVTYIAVNDDEILGFATVAAAHLEVDALPVAKRRKLPGYPLPVLRLGRLAVSMHARDLGVGRALVRHTFQLALEMSERYGCVGVLVD